MNVSHMIWISSAGQRVRARGLNSNVPMLLTKLASAGRFMTTAKGESICETFVIMTRHDLWRQAGKNYALRQDKTYPRHALGLAKAKVQRLV
jgi:hypothetical protein